MEPKKTKPKQEKFAFRFDPTTNSENGILFRYLRQFNHCSPFTKEKILKAVSAFWLPLAMEWEGKDREAVRKYLVSAKYELEAQIRFLYESLDFPLPNPSSSFYPPVYQALQPATGNSPSQQKDQNSSLCEDDEDYEAEPIIDPSAEEDFLKNF